MEEWGERKEIAEEDRGREKKKWPPLEGNENSADGRTEKKGENEGEQEKRMPHVLTHQNRGDPAAAPL